MQIQYTKNLNPGNLNEVAHSAYCLFSHNIWFKIRHLYDTDGDKSDRRFLFLGIGILTVLKVPIT